MAGANSKTRRRIENAGDELSKTVTFLDKMPEGQSAVCPKCGERAEVVPAQAVFLEELDLHDEEGVASEESARQGS